eukprot:12399374-Karenia_brevis.AAC.1
MPGFMPQLAPLLGTGSFDIGFESSRFARLLSGAVPLAGQLRDVWTGLRAEVDDSSCFLNQPAQCAGSESSHIQKDITRLRERARFQRLDVSIRALPASDFRRAAWVNMDAFSTAWVSTMPSDGCRVSNAEFAEITARYYGMPSPACKPLAGQPIGSTRLRLDAHGSNLVSAALPGDGWRRQHDSIKWRVAEDMREMGVRGRTEVYGLFAAALPPRARKDLGQWTQRKRQGMVPDFLAAVPVPPQAPADASDALFELKTLHFGTNTYPPQLEGRCQAVSRRAAALPAEYTTKAHRLDVEFTGTADGQVGPVERRLVAYGPVRGL